MQDPAKTGKNFSRLHDTSVKPIGKNLYKQL